MKNIIAISFSFFVCSLAIGQTDAENRAAQRERDVLMGKTTEPAQSNETGNQNGVISNRLPHQVPLKPVNPESNTATGTRSNLPGSEVEQNAPLKEAKAVDNTTVQPVRVDRVKLERHANPNEEQKNKKPTE